MRKPIVATSTYWEHSTFVSDWSIALLFTFLAVAVYVDAKGIVFWRGWVVLVVVVVFSRRILISVTAFTTCTCTCTASIVHS